jgi:hypothetical protein
VALIIAQCWAFASGSGSFGGGGTLVAVIAVLNFLSRAIRFLCASTASGFTAMLLASLHPLRRFLRQKRLKLHGQYREQDAGIPLHLYLFLLFSPR